MHESARRRPELPPARPPEPSGRLSEPEGTPACNQAFYEVLALNVRPISTGSVRPRTPGSSPFRAEAHPGVRRGETAV